MCFPRAGGHRCRGRATLSATRTVSPTWLRIGTGSVLLSRRALIMLRHSVTQSADVGVLGGGPAGTTVALALSRAGYSVVVFEKSAYSNLRIGETLPPGIQRLLTSLGIWDRFLADTHSLSFGIRSAWGQDDLYYNDFIFNP